MGVLRWSKAVYESQLNRMGSSLQHKYRHRDMAISDDSDDGNVVVRASFWREHDEVSSSAPWDDDEDKDGSIFAFTSNDEQEDRDKDDFSDGNDNDGASPSNFGNVWEQNDSASSWGQADDQVGQGQDHSGEGHDQTPGHDSSPSNNGGSNGNDKPQFQAQGNSGDHSDGSQDHGNPDHGHEDGSKPDSNNNNNNNNQTPGPEAPPTPTTPSTPTTPAPAADQSPSPPPPPQQPPPPHQKPPPPRPKPPPPAPQAATSSPSVPSSSPSGLLPGPSTLSALSIAPSSVPSPSAALLPLPLPFASQSAANPGSSQVLGPAQISPEALSATTAASVAVQLLPPLSTSALALPTLAPSSSTSSPTTDNEAASSSSSTQGPSMPMGMIAGITVGGVSAISVIGALIYLILRLKRGPTSRLRKQRGHPDGTLRERRRRSRRDSEPEMSDSLVNSAAPMAGLDKTRVLTKTEPNAVSASAGHPKSNRAAAAAGEETRKSSVFSIFKRRTQATTERGIDTTDVPMNEKRLSIITDATTAVDANMAENDDMPPQNPSSPALVEEPRSGGRPHLAQQADPAASVNCPYAKLQQKLRLHNSTNPRPCQKEVINRDSVSSTTTCTTCNSSPTSPLFAFSSFMKPPSLGFLKFENTTSVNTTTMPWRGSGWSVWFRQEDSKDRTSRTLEPQEK